MVACHHQLASLAAYLVLPHVEAAVAVRLNGELVVQVAWTMVQVLHQRPPLMVAVAAAQVVLQRSTSMGRPEARAVPVS